jgi:D-beta-D-heptose 7-phosphate kinase/D-beta-D-heptose 1-phosphate adenosyltransferase
MATPRLETRRLERMLREFADLRILVVGDVMLDEYLWGDVERISPEAPVPVVHVTRESTDLGGAGNVVRNVVALGAECLFSGVIGVDVAGDTIVDQLKDLGVDPSGLVRVEGRPTTRKTRIEARSQQMLRFDRETDEPIARKTAKRLLESIEGAIPRADAVVLEDYGKGVLPPQVLRNAMKRFTAASLQVSVDPKDSVQPYRGASFFKPNLREVEQLTQIRQRTDADLARAVTKIQRQLPGSDVVVTRGEKGMTIFPVGQPTVDVPIARHEVFDVQGAGDTAIATLSLARRAGANWVEAAVLANAAAGVVVGKVGTQTARPDEIRERLPEAIAAVRANGRRS